ncbi:MAG: type II secretion system F family protein [Alphaproteobacteria bacterium]|nr:type II secretion system F family protein [Alphaproteobacteria bacterium]OJV13709.1 MAG: hypothetical protein BGO27_00870 [Alphaproteobacteria bacterium 33-17]
MPQYKYQALNEKGRTISGNISAVNELELESKLKTLGLDVISCKEINETSGFFGGSKLTLQDLVVFCVQLEQLDRAGVPLLDAVGDLRDTTDNFHMKSILAEIFDSINKGKMLSAALAQHPKYFDEVFVGLVTAGEKTGNLADVFGHLADHLKWVDNIQRKIKKASYYPVFLMILMCIVIGVMMLFVIPQLSRFLLSQGFDLPIYTIALINTSNFFQKFWMYLALFPVITFFSLKFACKASEEFNYQMDAIFLRIPKIGETIRKIEVARFSRFLSITYRSGIGILDCLEIANNVVKNAVIKESVHAVKKAVSEGTSLTQAMTAANQFPSMVLRMVKVGEDSGRIDETLKNVNYFFDKEVDESVNTMIGLIQPTLTIILGGIMMWVSVAVFGPLYSSFSKMKF